MTFLDSNIMVLGSTGMLGTTVFKYLNSQGWSVFTNKYHWPSREFKEEIKMFDGVIINCIGGIPQKGTKDYTINYDLPVYLIETGKRIVQPCTDCVYSGNLEFKKKYNGYSNFDATDDYGLSKRKFAEYALKKPKNCKIIRCSIIGYDKDNVSLMSWLIHRSNSNNDCNGYTNHYWNGITTLEWAKILEHVLNNWDQQSNVLIPGINPVNKYDLLGIIAKVHKLKIKINPIEKDYESNKCLDYNIKCQDIEKQLLDMINFEKENME